MRYAGQYFDKESGLHYNRHRYYDPESSQYLSPDPIGLQDGLTPQVYVHNPNGWVDPLGLNLCKIAGADKLESVSAKNNNPQPDGITQNTRIENGKVMIDGKPANGNYDYVINETGQLKIGNGHYHLSNEAGSVKGAGQVYFENGKFSMIDNYSGYYQPTASQTQAAGTILKNNGLTVDDFFIMDVH